MNHSSRKALMLFKDGKEAFELITLVQTIIKTRKFTQFNNKPLEKDFARLETGMLHMLKEEPMRHYD